FGSSGSELGSALVQRFTCLARLYRAEAAQNERTLPPREVLSGLISGNWGGYVFCNREVGSIKKPGFGQGLMLRDFKIISLGVREEGVGRGTEPLKIVGAQWFDDWSPVVGELDPATGRLQLVIDIANGMPSRTRVIGALTHHGIFAVGADAAEGRPSIWGRHFPLRLCLWKESDDWAGGWPILTTDVHVKKVVDSIAQSIKVTTEEAS
ncbi:hypothetical protein HK405_008273, partial [Cladochytrium tenue]